MRIVFVDQDNACRSQLAEALVSLDAVEGVEAYSAGVEAGDALDTQTRRVMEELGYDMAGHFTKSLDDLPELEFDYAVSLGVGDPLLKARMSMEWDVPDPRGRDAEAMRATRDLLRARIRKLLVAPRVSD